MTITYTDRVANARMLGFSRLLFIWRGSIYKLVYKEMLLFCVLYGLLSLTYRLALNKEQKIMFEKIVLHCDIFTNLIPLSFVLGFYVSIVITRWWNQFTNIPWPDRAMMFVSTMIDGADERTRILRRTLMRYLTLSSLIVFQATSVVVKKRFPTMEHLLEAGVITIPEIQALEEVNTPHGRWWVPIIWACNLVKDARKEGKISDHYSMKTILEEFQSFRGQLGMLYSYDWISVPLVYTQVTTLAVYSFFVGCLFGRQFLDPERGYPGHEIDLVVPVFTLLQFFFYMGWLKVAEQLINPFGEDDDDFDINWVIDRNMQVSLLVVDDLHGYAPHCEKDIYFGENPPDFLPYTKSSVSSIRQPHMGSTADLSVSENGKQVVNPMITIPEGSVLDSNIISPYGVSASVVHSRPNSPIASPSKSRRIHNMLLQGIRTPLAGSKSSIDCSKLSVSDSKYPGQFMNLGQSLNGVGISQRPQHQMDGFISEPNSNAGTPVGLYLTKSPFEHLMNGRETNSPNSPVDEKTMFTMDMDEHCDTSRNPSIYDMKNICLENPDVTRVRLIEGQSRRFTVTEIADPSHKHQQPYQQKEDEHVIDETKMKSESFRLSSNTRDSNKVSQGKCPNTPMMHHNQYACDKQSDHVTVETVTCTQNDPVNTQLESKHVQSLDLAENHVNTSNHRKRHESSSSGGSSSCSSLPAYEGPDSTQATISSLTPLLPSSQTFSFTEEV